MSEELSAPAAAPEALPANSSNFDAIVARNVARREAAAAADDAPDTQEAETETEEAPAQRTRKQPEPDETEDDPEPEEADDEPDENAEEAPGVAAGPQSAPFKALREAIKTKKITPKLLEALGDLDWEIDLPGGRSNFKLKDIPGGVMRQARFSREMEKTKEDQARANNILEIERARTATWRQNPAELERGLVAMGCGQTARQVFVKWMREEYAWLQASPEQKQQMQQMKQFEHQRAQERAQYMEMQRKLEAMEQQAGPPLDPASRQAAEFINNNLDGVLNVALKKFSAGRISDHARVAFTDELQALAQSGIPLQQAMVEAAEIVADRFAERRELARAAAQQEERARPKEVAGKRAPAGGPGRRDDNSGRFTSKPSRKDKPAPTAAEFGKRFNI